MVVGQRSVKEKEWLETFKIFGIGKEDGMKIIGRLGYTLFNEHEKLSYWQHTTSVRVSQPPRRSELRRKYNNGDTLVVNL